MRLWDLDNVKISCLAAGKPPLTYEWFQVKETGEKIKQGDSRTLMVGSGKCSVPSGNNVFCKVTDANEVVESKKKKIDLLQK